MQAKNPNFKMNFIKRGSVWNVFFRLAGRQFSLSTGETDLAKAQVQGARIFLTHVARGETGEIKTVEEAIQLYWRWHAEPSPKKKPQWETAHKYEVCLRRVCALLKITELGGLAQAAPGITARSLGVKESNYNSLVRLSAALFRRDFLIWAESIGKKLSNPFLGHVPKVPLQKQFVAPPKSFVKSLNASAEKELERNELLTFKLCLGAGLRVGEATHQTWANILERSILVEHTSARRTKSGKSREVPVSASLIASLEAHRGLPDNYVVADVSPPKLSKHGQPLRRADRVTKRLREWLKAKGVKDKRPTHWLRKVFASTVTKQDDIHTASKWLGHSSVVVTERVYSGVAEDLFAAVI